MEGAYVLSTDYLFQPRRGRWLWECPKFNQPCRSEVALGANHRVRPRSVLSPSITRRTRGPVAPRAPARGIPSLA